MTPPAAEGLSPCASPLQQGRCPTQRRFSNTYGHLRISSGAESLPQTPQQLQTIHQPHPRAIPNPHWESPTHSSPIVPSLLPFPVLGCVCPRSLLQEISPCSAQPGASTWLVSVTPERGVPTEPAGAAPAPPCHSDCGAAATAADRRGKGSSSPAPGDAPHPPRAQIPTFPCATSSAPRALCPRTRSGQDSCTPLPSWAAQRSGARL